MSLHAIAWLSLFLLFARLTFRRSSWGIPLYLLVVYESPATAWWASGLVSVVGGRWHLAASLIFALSVLLDEGRKPSIEGKSTRPTLVLSLLLLYCINATAVHILFASDQEYSWFGLQLLWKEALMLFLMIVAIKDKFDVHLLIYSIILGCAYNGYQAYIGEIKGQDGRVGGNGLAAMLCMSLPLGGYVLFYGSMRERGVAALSLVFTLNAILGTVSRGAYLSMVGAGAWLLFDTKGPVRRIAITGIALLPVAAYLMTSEADIDKNLARFSTTFASAEERDSSATGRMRFWEQALKLIADHPFGSGYEAAFRSERGYAYINHMWDRQRICHNSYLSIAAGWGVQGLLLFLALLTTAWLRVGASLSQARAMGDEQAAFLGSCIRASLVTLLITGMFGSHLNADWSCLWIALAVTYERVFQPEVTDEVESEETNLIEESPITDQVEEHTELTR